MGFLFTFSLLLASLMAILIVVSWKKLNYYLKISLLLLFAIPLVYSFVHRNAIVVIVDSLLTMGAMITIYLGMLRREE